LITRQIYQQISKLPATKITIMVTKQRKKHTKLLMAWRQ